MKKIVTISATMLVTALLLLPVFVQGQRQILPSSLVGVDLKKVQQELQKGVDKGIDSLLLPYADALFHSGQITGAFMTYMRADSLDFELSPVQQRNLVHAARRLGRTSPYHQETGYFSSDWQPVARVEKHCVNTPQEDFAPYVWNDILFVTSSRHVLNRRQQETYRFTQLPFLSVFAFDQECNTIYPEFLPEELNTSLHDGPLAIAKDTSLLIITRNFKKPNEDQLQNLYLDFYTRNEGVWSEAIMFPYSDPDYSIQHPYFDDKTNTLYFSSDMPGGFGGFDLYTSSWDGESWGEPENMGPEINSAFDEVFPTLSPSNDLYFSSNHLESKGGLDLVVFKNGRRQLLPPPFNTLYDDLSITFIDETSGYFASNRNQSLFDDDIYFFTMTPRPFLVRVLDSETTLPLQGVRVGFTADTPPLDDNLITNVSGEGQLHAGHETAFPVQIMLSKEGYIPVDTLTDHFILENNRWVLTLTMQEMPKELTIEEVIPEGFFVVYFDNDHPDPDSWQTTTDLRYDETYQAFKERWPVFFQRSASSRQELEAFFEEAETGMYQLEFLAGFLTTEFAQGRQYIIEFTSHASPLATNEYNLNLSKRRFVSVENFLKTWDEGTLMSFINQHLLDYDNNPFGAALAPPTVSGDPRDPARSIYSVEASRERRVTISWRRDVSR